MSTRHSISFPRPQQSKDMLLCSFRVKHIIVFVRKYLMSAHQPRKGFIAQLEGFSRLQKCKENPEINKLSLHFCSSEGRNELDIKECVHLKNTLKAYFLRLSEVRLADLGTTTAQRQLLRTHYLNAVTVVFENITIYCTKFLLTNSAKYGKILM